MAAIEIVQVLPHLLQRKSQREEPLRDIDGQAADQALAAQRGDFGGIGAAAPHRPAGSSAAPLPLRKMRPPRDRR